MTQTMIKFAATYLSNLGTQTISMTPVWFRSRHGFLTGTTYFMMFRRRPWGLKSDA